MEKKHAHKMTQNHNINASWRWYFAGKSFCFQLMRCAATMPHAIQSEKFSLLQTALSTEFETTSSTQQPDEDLQSFTELPRIKEAPNGDKMRHQSSISVVGPQTPTIWRYVPKISPPPRTLPPPPPQPGAFMKGKSTGLHHNYVLSLVTSWTFTFIHTQI